MSLRGIFYNFIVIIFLIQLSSYVHGEQTENNQPVTSENNTDSINNNTQNEATTQQSDQSATDQPSEQNTEQIGEYTVRLRDIQQRINRLKEQIFRSKARLSLLSESVLEGSIAGSKSVIVFKDEMGGNFRLVKAVFSLDGAPLLSKMSEDGVMQDSDQLQLYNGSIVPGEHLVNVTLEYRGHGYGIFSYLKGYRFKVRSSHNFTATEGKTISVKIITFEKGGPTTPLEERPAIRYVEKVQSGIGSEETVTTDE